MGARTLRGIQTRRRRFDKPAPMPKYNHEASRIFAVGNVTNMAENLTEIGERQIVVTESAARRIAFLKDQEQAEGAWLRIAVSGGGCSGFQYGLTFDEQTNPDDIVELTAGFTIEIFTWITEGAHRAVLKTSLVEPPAWISVF